MSITGWRNTTYPGPTELTLYEAGESRVFGRTDEVPERLAVIETTRRAVDPNSFTPEYKTFLVKLEKLG